MGSTIKEQYYFNRCEKDSHYEEIDVLEATKDQVEMEFAFGYTDEQGNDYDMHRVHVTLTSEDVNKIMEAICSDSPMDDIKAKAELCVYDGSKAGIYDDYTLLQLEQEGTIVKRRGTYDMLLSFELDCKIQRPNLGIDGTDKCSLTIGKIDYKEGNALYDAFGYADMVLRVYKDMEEAEEFRRIIFG